MLQLPCPAPPAGQPRKALRSLKDSHLSWPCKPTSGLAACAARKFCKAAAAIVTSLTCVKKACTSESTGWAPLPVGDCEPGSINTAYSKYSGQTKAHAQSPYGTFTDALGPFRPGSARTILTPRRLRMSKSKLCARAHAQLFP